MTEAELWLCLITGVVVWVIAYWVGYRTCMRDFREYRRTRDRHAQQQGPNPAP